MTIYLANYNMAERQFLQDVERNGGLPAWMAPYLDHELRAMVTLMILRGELRLSDYHGCTLLINGPVLLANPSLLKLPEK